MPLKSPGGVHLINGAGALRGEAARGPSPCTKRAARRGSFVEPLPGQAQCLRATPTKLHVLNGGNSASSKIKTNQRKFGAWLFQIPDWDGLGGCGGNML